MEIFLSNLQNTPSNLLLNSLLPLTWLTYCRYGVKHYTISQSIILLLQSIKHFMLLNV